jgi:hypothetical protein
MGCMNKEVEASGCRPKQAGAAPRHDWVGKLRVFERRVRTPPVSEQQGSRDCQEEGATSLTEKETKQEGGAGCCKTRGLGH